MRKIWLLPLVILVLSTEVFAGTIWYEDNSFARGDLLPDDFIFKFQKSESWIEARNNLDVYMFRVNMFSDVHFPQLTDQFITVQMLPLLKNSQIKVAFDSAAPLLAGCKIRSNRVKIELEWVSRIKRLGMDVDYISLQSILSKPRRDITNERECSLTERVDSGVAYAKQFSAMFPKTEFGIIDALPSHGKPYKEAYKFVRDVFRSQNVPLRYIHLDVSADMIRRGTNGLSWEKIIQVEQYVHELGLEFGMLFTSRKAGYLSDEAFYKTIVGELDEYLAAGGKADHYVISSWFPYPMKTVRRSPEDTQGFPITDAVIEFSRRIQSPLMPIEKVPGQ